MLDLPVRRRQGSSLHLAGRIRLTSEIIQRIRRVGATGQKGMSRIHRRRPTPEEEVQEVDGVSEVDSLVVVGVGRFPASG